MKRDVKWFLGMFGVVLFLALLLSLTAEAKTTCGVERWAVKTLADKTASRIDPHVINITVRELTELQAPAHRPETTRLDGPETSIYKVHVLIIGVMIERDGDYHIVIADPVEPKITMIVEIPSPKCAKHLDSAAGLRAKMDKLHKPTSKFYAFAKPIKQTFTGVGFFDMIHGTYKNENGVEGQEGVAPNGLELHPLISWND